MNGADALTATLLDGGVDVCFANPGTSEMHFVAALDRNPEMRCVLGLFEGVVTGAADGYARMADRPAATLLHLGPGLANGLANLHNARRANSPIVNIVGDHATYHLAVDAPLTSDIEGLARPMSKWVRTARSADTVSSDAAEAISAARGAPAGVATLILPADTAWNATTNKTVHKPHVPSSVAVDQTLLETAAKVLRSGKKTMLLLGDTALRANALDIAERIGAATGARLLAQQSNRRIERGAGRVSIDRTIYAIAGARAAMADIEAVILIGATEPAAFFAYPGQPSRPLPPDCLVYRLTGVGMDHLATLQALAEAVGAGKAGAARSVAAASPVRPTGALDRASLAAAIAACLPEGAIVVDESLTEGQGIFGATHHAAPHDHLQITGGAIGIGLPLAAGAAVACPDRKVICLQADGSGMYTVQALWTHARENLDVITVVLANRSYAILHGELRNVGASSPGVNARRMLDLDQPALDWVGLAKSMGVDAARAEDADALVRLLDAAVARKGPFLIEAVMPPVPI
jgi:acetolactate synthase-1/2/3 large subunit